MYTHYIMEVERHDKDNIIVFMIHLFLPKKLLLCLSSIDHAPATLDPPVIILLMSFN